MKKKLQKILIPARHNVPETHLGLCIVYQNEKALESLPYTFILPGGPGANHSYYSDYDCLYEVSNLIYYDPRGCGLSDEGDAFTYTMANYIDDLQFIRKALQLSTVNLFGTSYGAMCALGYTLRYPEEVNKLILAAGTPTHEFVEKAQSNIRVKGSKAQQDICDTLWKGEFKNDEHVTHYLEIMESMYSWKVRNNRPITGTPPTHPLSFKVLNEGFKHQFWNFNYTSQLNSIHCPTLILVGEEDWITDPIYSKEMAAQIPDSTLKIFKNSDHSMDTDVPDLFFDAIKAFLVSKTARPTKEHT